MLRVIKTAIIFNKVLNKSQTDIAFHPHITITLHHILFHFYRKTIKFRKHEVTSATTFLLVIFFIAQTKEFGC